MTRIFGTYIDGEMNLRVNSRMQNLQLASDKELENKVKAGFQYAYLKDLNRSSLGF